MYNLTRINNNYYDLTLYNATENNIPVVFDVNRMIPYLYSENSDISIVRFDLNNDCIPVYIPTINTDFSESIVDFDIINASKFPVSAFSSPFSDANTTSLNIVVQDNESGITSAGFVKWVPEDVTKTQPQIPKNEQETINNKYYYAYNSLHVAVLVENAINEAIQTLYNTLHTFGANTSPLYGMQAPLPRIKLVLTDKSFFMLFPQEFDGVLDSIEINFNRDLWRLFPFYASPNNKLPKKYKSLLIKDLQLAPFGTSQYYTMKLKYNPTSWGKFYRMALKTDYLPIVSEMTYNNTMENTNSISAVITDYILNDSTDPDETYDKISFEPQVTSFRPVALNLNKTNETRFQCYFVLRTPQGSEVPLEIEPERYASIKVLIKQD